MPNIITPYDHFWYANKAIELLNPMLGFTKTMYRAYEDEPQRKGSTIKIRKPGKIPAQAMPAAASSDLEPEEIPMVLDQYWGTQYEVTDKELAYTGEQLVNEHIAPAMQGLAEKIETVSNALYAFVPHRRTLAGAAAIADLIALRKALSDLYVPMANRSLEMSNQIEADFLAITNFLNANEGSDGGQVQREGRLGRKFAFDLYPNSLIPSHVMGTLATTGTVALNGAVTKGATQVTIDASTSMTGTLKQGDTFTIAGDTRPYAVAADAVAAGNAITVPISPAARQDYADNAVVTFVLQSKEVSLAYHQEAFAIATAPLKDRGTQFGVQQAVVVDPRTNLSLRFTRWYDPGLAKEFIKFDCLFGVKAIDPDRAIRLER